MMYTTAVKITYHFPLFLSRIDLILMLQIINSEMINGYLILIPVDFKREKTNSISNSDLTMLVQRPRK